MQAVRDLVIEYSHEASPEAIAMLEAGLDERRPDWRQKFTEDLPEHIDLRGVIGRVLGLLLLQAEHTSMQDLQSATGHAPASPEEGARVMGALFVRHLSGARLAA